MRPVASRGRVFVAALALLSLVACSSAPDEAAPADAAATGDTLTLSASSQQIAGIVVEPVGVKARSSVIEAVATVALDDTRTARVGALVEGIVAATRVNVGDRVRQGAELAGLHSHAVHDGWGDYRKAVADRRRLEQELTFADDATARAERLLKAKASSTLEVERARAASASVAQQLVAANAEVRRAQESLEHLGLTVGSPGDAKVNEIIPVRTPIKGVVLEKLATTGTTVTPGTPLFVVSDISSLWVLAEIDEAMLARVAFGMPAEVAVAAYPDARFAATVTLVGDTINPETRRVVVRCAVPNADGRLKPGMFARVQFASGAPVETIDVPADAVQDVGDRRVVFVAGDGGRFVARDVETGSERGGRIEVRRGLAAGDRIVTHGAFLLKSQILTVPDGES